MTSNKLEQSYIFIVGYTTNQNMFESPYLIHLVLSSTLATTVFPWKSIDNIKDINGQHKLNFRDHEMLQ